MSTNFRTPMKTALGLGSARSGAHHFMALRITSVALIALCVWFVWLVLAALHTDYAGARALVAEPWNAVLMIAFLIASFWHAQLGLQTIVEERMRGRVMAYYAMAFLGTAPIGSLLAGIVAEHVGVQTTILLGGVACIAGAIWFAVELPRLREIVRPIYVKLGIIAPPEAQAAAMADAGAETL